MTYSSFLSVFGPGQEIKKEFEKQCECNIEWIKVPDSTLFIQRLSLKKDGFKTDVVVGLDQLSLKEAKTLSWEKIEGIKANKFLPPVSVFLSSQFIPYDWSPMSFISRKKRQPLNLQDLLASEFKNKISLPSPLTSTVGLQFYYWIWTIFQEKTKDFLSSFKEQLYGLPPSWSTSYSLFQRGHVYLSFSYLSSLLYHRDQNQKDFYFVTFKEGHPFQVELAGVSSFCTQCDIGKMFIRFLISPKAQTLLQKKNYMFPVIKALPEDTLLQKNKWKFIKYDKWDLFLDYRKDHSHFFD